ncbi:uncharacterized protein LOC126651334 [Myiozetetes cayanensis]|uniref:uncharacterized protein LOC126651334 n=1 Tax=Myiozetetes cayanensis TaxID=478635 RepID=UPI00215E40FC|nr:uncharacterized protein LOC126651334 [Myiozetetes cayanensis]
MGQGSPCPSSHLGRFRAASRLTSRGNPSSGKHAPHRVANHPERAWGDTGRGEFWESLMLTREVGFGATVLDLGVGVRRERKITAIPSFFLLLTQVLKIRGREEEWEHPGPSGQLQLHFQSVVSFPMDAPMDCSISTVSPPQQCAANGRTPSSPAPPSTSLALQPELHKEKSIPAFQKKQLPVAFFSNPSHLPPPPLLAQGAQPVAKLAVSSRGIWAGKSRKRGWLCWNIPRQPPHPSLLAQGFVPVLEHGWDPAIPAPIGTTSQKEKGMWKEAGALGCLFPAPGEAGYNPAEILLISRGLWRC